MSDKKMERLPQNTYQDALQVAWRELEGREPDKIAADGLLAFETLTGLIDIPFLGDHYKVDLIRKRVIFGDGQDVYPFLSVLLLHYLMGVSDRPLTGEWISFREFEGGDSYIGSFTNRTLIPLKNTFGDQPKLLEKAAASLGASRLDFGDIGLCIPVFPKLPLAIVVWLGDEEFPPDVNVLYDKTANDILRTEDLAICGALTMSKLHKNAQKLSK